jgi:hypothetical protein
MAVQRYNVGAVKALQQTRGSGPLSRTTRSANFSTTTKVVADWQNNSMSQPPPNEEINKALPDLSKMDKDTPTASSDATSIVEQSTGSLITLTGASSSTAAQAAPSLMPHININIKNAKDKLPSVDNTFKREMIL